MTREPNRRETGPWPWIAFVIVGVMALWVTSGMLRPTTSGAGGGSSSLTHEAFGFREPDGTVATILAVLVTQTAPSPTATPTPERTPTPWVIVATLVPAPTSTPVDAYGSPACQAGETCRAFKRLTVVTPVVWCDELQDDEIPTHGRECVARDAHGTWADEEVGS